jgi:hypothetical protein
MSDDPPAIRDAADVSLRIGKSIAFDARITSRGLLSVGALVSGILLSTAVIVVAAKRKDFGRGSARLNSNLD